MNPGAVLAPRRLRSHRPLAMIGTLAGAPRVGGHHRCCRHVVAAAIALASDAMSRYWSRLGVR
jgi:hypothetical protein